MQYISVPLIYGNNANSGLEDASAGLKRQLNGVVAMLDNLIELLVYTPQGTFAADPEFGFDYWNYEFANIDYKSFNEGLTNIRLDEVTQQRCQASLLLGLQNYAPMLEYPSVSVRMVATDEVPYRRKNRKYARHAVIVNVRGILRDGLGENEYHKQVVFLVEPTIKVVNRHG